jgi:ribosome assembly protein 4
MFFLFVRFGSSLLPSTRSSDASSGHSSPILCASFSPTGNLLATGSGDASARLWDLFTETPSHTLSGHKDWVLCVEWEALERKLATGGHDSHVSFWRARYFSNVGRHLISSSKVRIWDPKTGKPIGDALRGHTKWIMSLSWEPIHMFVDGPLLFSAAC